MQVFDAPVGTLIVNPANVESGNRWNTVRENLTVGYEPGQLAMLAEQEFGQAGLKLEPPAFGHVDQHALAISHLLKDELASKTASELYVDSLITVFGIHMIRHYSGAGRASSRSKSVVACRQRVLDKCRSTCERRFQAGFLSPSSRGSANAHRAVSSLHLPRLLVSRRIAIF